MKTFEEYKDFFLTNYTDLDKVIFNKDSQGRRLLGPPNFVISLYKFEKIRKLSKNDEVLLNQIDSNFAGTTNNQGYRRLWFDYETFKDAYDRYVELHKSIPYDPLRYW